ncbi:MAG: hypothetical protein Q7S22_04055 [Candidatus Micrarchaeota archaeon]|nr:hypothetical protein [Candidatus Micrarchaeota archaeon]
MQKTSYRPIKIDPRMPHVDIHDTLTFAKMLNRLEVEVPIPTPVASAGVPLTKAVFRKIVEITGPLQNINFLDVLSLRQPNDRYGNVLNAIMQLGLSGNYDISLANYTSVVPPGGTGYILDYHAPFTTNYPSVSADIVYTSMLFGSSMHSAAVTLVIDMLMKFSGLPDSDKAAFLAEFPNFNNLRKRCVGQKYGEFSRSNQIVITALELMEFLIQTYCKASVKPGGLIAHFSAFGEKPTMYVAQAAGLESKKVCGISIAEDEPDYGLLYLFTPSS